LPSARPFTIEDKEKGREGLRAAGHTMLDCPVSGTGSQARTGDLVIYCERHPKAVAKIKPVFAGFSRKMYDVGVFGNGSKMKIRRQPARGDQQRRFRGSHGDGMKAGLDPNVIFEMISNGAGKFPRVRAPRTDDG